jgi:predicted murein hydrolase (TIGR00659 family)
MTDLTDIWTYLAQQPLLWLTLTLMAYVIGDTASRLSGRRPYVNPVLISVVLLACVLWVTSTPYQDYFEGAKFVHFMLGPATVALAVPLYRNLDKVRQSAVPLLCALVAGSGTAILSVLGIAYLLGVRGEVLLSLAPKSVTAPVAIGVSDAIGGSPTLTAVAVIVTGVMGAILATPVLNLLGIRDWRARGFSVGIASHGIGTARAFQVNETAGAFAGIGMGLNALLTAIAAPYLVRLFM